jgi:hypothetical protein
LLLVGVVRNSLRHGTAVSSQAGDLARHRAAEGSMHLALYQVFVFKQIYEHRFLEI